MLWRSHLMEFYVGKLLLGNLGNSEICRWEILRPNDVVGKGCREMSSDNVVGLFFGNSVLESMLLERVKIEHSRKFYGGWGQKGRI
jgi:hypothetical protein